ncbi:hypothetical protein CEE44_00600 [Candidatus Woesearchaeota archaeon B3_Woes]|nr:MAG: hypothetical protein CEE44_00600 [Candidatus Woesearchaeota archaeon B3_Woes]
MASKSRQVELPDLVRVIGCQTGNTKFDNALFEIFLNIKIGNTAEWFEISLNAKNKKNEKLIRIETRVAIEKHEEGKGHCVPHLQINNFASDEETLGKGTLRIILQVCSKEELEECCEGFTYSLKEILGVIENIYGQKVGLVDYFFYPNKLLELKDKQKVLHKLILKSFHDNMLTFKDEDIKLIEYKGKKNEPPLDTRDLFKIMRILHHLKILNPILLEPLYNLVFDNEEIKTKCKQLDFEDFEGAFNEKPTAEMKHYNKDQFIKEYAK